MKRAAVHATLNRAMTWIKSRLDKNVDEAGTERAIAIRNGCLRLLQQTVWLHPIAAGLKTFPREHHGWLTREEGRLEELRRIGLGYVTQSGNRVLRDLVVFTQSAVATSSFAEPFKLPDDFPFIQTRAPMSEEQKHHLRMMAATRKREREEMLQAARRRHLSS